MWLPNSICCCIESEPLEEACQGQTGQETVGALEATPHRRKLRAAQRMVISARMGRPHRVPQLTPTPLAITSPSSTARPSGK
jgi:hypothetical protein